MSNIPTLNGNVELAKLRLVLQATHNLKDIIVCCYGSGEHYYSNFSDGRMEKLFYDVNSVACEIIDQMEKLGGE